MEELEKNTIHGHVDLEIIKEVKENVSIPVIGNGDIKTASDAKKMFEYTNVDGIMMGRATLGTPWIIGQIIDELGGKEKQEISNETKLGMFTFKLLIKISFPNFKLPFNKIIFLCSANFHLKKFL